MKYFKTLNLYKNSTGTNIFNLDTKQAVSYNWWLYVAEIKGQIVFNYYPYSSTTWRHQRDTWNLLGDLNLYPDLVIFAPDGLQNLSSAIDFERSEIRSLIKKIKKPRSHKAKNNERRAEIRQRLKTIKQIKELMA